MKLTYLATALLIVLVGAGVYLVVQNENEGEKKELQASFDKKLLQMQQDQAKRDDEMRKKLDAALEATKQPAAVEKPAAAVTGADPEEVIDPQVKQGLKNVKEVVQGNKVAPGNKNVRPTATGATGPRPAAAPEVAPEPPDYGADAAANPSLDDVIAQRAEESLVNDAGLDRAAIERAKTGNGVIENEEELGKLNNLQQLIAGRPRIARVGDARAADRAGFVVLDEGQNKGIAKGDRFAVRRGTVIVARIVVGNTVEPSQCVADIVPNTLVSGMSIKNGDDIIQFDR